MRWPRSRPNIAEVAPSRVSTPSAGTRAISLSMSAASRAPAQAAPPPATTAATGAATLRLPAVADADPRLALVTSAPAAAVLAAVLALRGGHDVDHPTWTDAYYATARSAP